MIEFLEFLQWIYLPFIVFEKLSTLELDNLTDASALIKLNITLRVFLLYLRFFYMMVSLNNNLQYLFILVSIFVVTSFQTTANLSEYGVDISYPIHHYIDEKGS